ncbi:MAG: helix-turn-helix domain-containing protein [Prevotella sp.]|nr:helix-turn-helix domain-containing protein [Parabacteroides sp.]MDY4653207.1 helix-turn-helix domain-containing protein [Prevotella sp.]
MAVAKYFFPGDTVDNARKLLFAIQVFVVVYFGYRKLRTFDREIANVYADTEGRDTTAVKHLLIAFVLTSLCSAVANALGRHYFAQSDWMVLAVLTPFTVMLFALSYIGFTRDFSFEQFVEDSKESIEQPTENTPAMEESEIGKSIDHLFITQQLYLTPNFKIGDLVKATGICRTHLSNYINQTKGMSFSDYINSLRVEHAKRLLSQNTENTKIVTIATQSGFSSEQSFYRNFHKFTGMKPLEWVKGQHLE